MKIGYLMQAGVPDVRRRLLSGPANHVRQVFGELGVLGHQLRLLATLEGQIWKSDNLEDYELIAIPGLDQGLFRLFEGGVRRMQSQLGMPYIALFESFRFAHACRQELADFDLFYERMGWMGYGGGLASRWLDIPLVIEVNGDHLSELEMLDLAPRGLQRKLLLILMSQSVRRAARVVATGQGWRQEFLKRWKIEPEKVCVIENGSEIVELLSRNQLSAFKPVESQSQNVVVVYLGAFEPWHGVLILVRAVARVISRGIPVQLVLIGTGTQIKEIEKLIKDLNIQGHVILTGRIAPSEYAAVLADADIGVSSYCGRVEFSGLKLLDYKSAGLATIASGEDGQPAIVEHGKTGWIVPPCDEEALSEAIILLAKSVGLRHEIGRRARIEAENCHRWRHTAQKLDDLFSQMIA